MNDNKFTPSSCLTMVTSNVPYSNDSKYFYCVPPETFVFDELDTLGKKNNMTFTVALWHPKPSYHVFKTGSLIIRNELYPAGLIFVSKKEGRPMVYRQ